VNHRQLDECPRAIAAAIETERSATMRFLITAAAVLITGFSIAVPSSAEPCFRGRRLPACQSFLLIENSYAYRVSGGGNEDRTHYVFGEFGWMRNRSERWALGGTVSVGFRGHYSGEIRGGAAARLRRWVAEDRSIDFSLGPFVAEADGEGGLGAAGQVNYNYGDRFHLTSRWEYVKVPKVDSFGWYLGLGFGSKTALIVGGIVGALLGGTALATD